MAKCLNYTQCGNQAREPHALCQSCQDTINRLVNPSAEDEKKLKKLEEKPRGGREWLNELAK